MQESTEEKRNRDLQCIIDQKSTVEKMLDAIYQNRQIAEQQIETNRKLRELHEQVQGHDKKFEHHSTVLESLKTIIDNLRTQVAGTIDEMTNTNNQQNVKLSEIQLTQSEIKDNLEILSPYIDKAKWFKSAKWPIIYSIVVTIILFITLDANGKIDFIKTLLGFI